MRIARWVWVSLVVVGCGSTAAPPSYPPLAPEQPAAPIQPLADELVPLPETDPAYDPALGTPPASKPQGGPITITVRTPQIGDIRTRQLRMRNVIDNVFEDGKQWRQLSSNRYDFREELWKIEGEALLFKVRVLHATEAVMLKDKPHSVTVATGDYIITALGPGKRAGVAREDGSELGTREVEELSDLFGFESARPHPLVEIASKRALRVGESVEMTADENTVFGGGQKVTAPVHLTLLAATPTTARFQVDVLLTFGDRERRLRYDITLERATGRLRELHELMHERETGEGMRQEQVQHLAMTVSPAS
ncbi:MAG TPA: hypothetical protein VIU61_23515 [Kofleriaceae bacterium]